MHALTPEKKIPLKPQSAKKFKAIVETGRRVFLESGYAETSMDRIADEAQVSKRTLYNHFSSKYELFCHILMEMTRNVIPESSKELYVDDLPIEEALTTLSINFLKTIYSPSVVALLRMVIAESRQFPELGILMFDSVIARSHSIVEEYFKRKISRAELHLADTHLATVQFIGLLKTDLQLRLLLGKRKRISTSEIEEVAKSCVEIFLCHTKIHK